MAVSPWDLPLPHCCVMGLIVLRAHRAHGRLLRAPKHTDFQGWGPPKSRLKALGHAERHTKALEGTAKETEGLQGYPKLPRGALLEQKNKQSSAGFPIASPAS